MKILSIKTKEIQVSYKEPIKVAGHTFNSRSGYELEVETDKGSISSELCLLKDFHPSTYSEALSAYADLDSYENWPNDIKFPIEAALLGLSSPKLNNGTVAINGYYDPSVSTSIPDIDCLKVKIGRNDLSEDKELLKKLSDKRLRLDANQSLSDGSFKEYAKLVSEYDYFEEPFLNIDSFKKFNSYKFALDENVQNEELQSLPQVTTFVLKPSLLGLSKTLALIEKAKILGKRVVISSTFEGEHGLINLLRICSYTDQYLGHREEHGLGTIRFLSDSLKNLGICAVNKSINIDF